MKQETKRNKENRVMENKETEGKKSPPFEKMDYKWLSRVPPTPSMD
jgi:hypothetical protein